MVINEIFIKDGITIFTGIVIAILLSRECLFQPNIINV